MKNYNEKERSCEATFFSAGPYWHAYTLGKETPILFTGSDDLRFAMNVIAQAADKFPELRIIAFEVMNNHFHFVISGSESVIQAFFEFIRKRIFRSVPGIKYAKLTIKPIKDLHSLRNNIIYTNRNGYVADPNYTPFSYPWGTGCYYFTQFPLEKTYSDLYTGARRKMFRGRAPKLPGDWKMIDGYIAPKSYCAIIFGMAIFRDAHHYFSMVSKNVEAYSELAAEIDDGEFLTDTELFTQVTKIVKSGYGLNALKDLSKAQKLDLARKLHYDYRSSNGQIRRTLGLTQYEVDSLFPLSADKSR